MLLCRRVNRLHPAHQLLPGNLESLAEARGNFNSGYVLAGFYELHIATADVCFFGKFFLGQFCCIA